MKKIIFQFSGRISDPISTALLVFQPLRNSEFRLRKMNSAAIKTGNSFGRLKSKSDKKFFKKLKKLESQFPDIFLFNEEFACNDEIYLLPRDLARIDSEFIGVIH